MKDNIVVANWLGYKRLPDGGCAIKCYADGGTVTVLDRDEYDFLRRIRDDDIEMDEICEDEWMERTLMKFAEGGMLRLQKSPCSDDKHTCYTLFRFRRLKRTGIPRFCLRLIGMLTMLMAPFSLLYAVYFLYNHKMNVSAVADCLTLSGMAISALLGTCLHEFGHAASAWGHGARVFEFGFMTYRKLIFSGAYVLNDSDYVCERMGRIQTSLAGLEMNLILSALFFLMAEQFPVWGNFAVCGAITNLGLVGWNLFADETDGMSAMEDILQDAHVNRSIRRAMLFFLPRRHSKNKREHPSASHFVTCFSIGMIRLTPVVYWLAIMSSLLHFQWRLGKVFLFLLCFATFFSIGIFVWLIWNYGRQMVVDIRQVHRHLEEHKR